MHTRPLLVTCALLIAVLAIPAHTSARPSQAIRFQPLNGGKPILPNVIVTTMTFAHDGTIYAGGRFIIPTTDPIAPGPYYSAGSDFLVSHDGGRTWSQNISTRDYHKVLTNNPFIHWRDHTHWPLDFDALSIAVDPADPRILLVAGCTASDPVCAAADLQPGHMLLRSDDGGRTWNDALTFAFRSSSRIDTNIIKTPDFRAVLRSQDTGPWIAGAVVFDPQHHGRVYVSTSGFGVLRSNDGARTWRYVSQPRRYFGLSELLLDPHNSAILYNVDRGDGKLYRSMDAGQHWTLQSSLGVQHMAKNLGGNPFMANPVIVGRSLYVTISPGLFASTDGGKQWHQTLPLPIPHSFVAATFRGSEGWIEVAGTQTDEPPTGIYILRDGQTHWQVASYSLLHLSHGFKEILDTNGVYYGECLWEDHARHVVYTSSSDGGLYLWSSGI